MKHICANCGKEFETKFKSYYCSALCREIFYSKKQFPDGSDYAECKICGFRGKQINKHIATVHKMTLDEYTTKFNITKYELMTENMHKIASERVKKAVAEGKCGWKKGGKNPSHDKECKSGRRSPFSKNYRGYDGLTDEEKEQKISQLLKNISENIDKNHNRATTIEYYLKRGFSEEEAKIKLKERQATFSLEKCIEKYGEVEGKKKWEERQQKWQNTLNNKSEEEKNRINKLKASAVVNICSYSKISQELFNKILDKIKNKYKKIYFATYHEGRKIENSNKNYEYEVILKDNIHRYFLDFYVKDINKVIEFDGDYWHSEKRGNQERDRKREVQLKSLGFTSIFHVKEQDFKKDPEKVINECLEYLNG